ncbi:MAG: hypothetical protein WBC91_11410 [Phototrophicaceae bacterium]
MVKQILKPFAVLIMLLGLMTACTTAATSNGDPIEFNGNVVSINNTTIVVGGFTVDVSNAAIPTNLQIGDTVRVTGIQQSSSIIAVVVVLTDDTAVIVSETAVPDVTAEASAVVDAPTAEIPVTTEAEATQVIVVESTQAEATEVVVVASTQVAQNPDINTDEPLIVVEGPVQSITINTITIFDIDIQVDPADPILTQIRIGDTIRIEGVSSIDSNIIIIVAVNITIIETSIIIFNNNTTVYIVPGIPANCRVKKSGKITCKNSRRS